MVLGLKRDLRVEGEGTIYPQEVSCVVAQCPKIDIPLRLLITMRDRPVVSHKSCAVISMQNAQR